MPRADPLEPVLSIGDVRVYPPHGVGEIVAIGSFDGAKTEETFYTMQVTGSGLRVIFPARRLNDIGLREVVSGDEVERVFQILRRPRKRGRKPSWNKHQRLLAAKLQTGSIFDAACVVNTIYLLKERKNLSFTECLLLDAALHLVLPELAIASDRTEDALGREIRSYFAL